MDDRRRSDEGRLRPLAAELAVRLREEGVVRTRFGGGGFA